MVIHRVKNGGPLFMRVTVRPAVKFPDMIRPKRVAAYCRVSTEQEIQYHSLEIQKKYFLVFCFVCENWRDEGLNIVGEIE